MTSSTNQHLHPVALAENLLQLVKSLYPSSETSIADDSKESYIAKGHLQSLTGQLLRSVLGPADYTVALAESCHESAALQLITSLGVADIIGDGALSLHELSQKTNVEHKYLSVTMRSLLWHGYFEEQGEFGTEVYANNAMSEVLKTSNDATLKDAIGMIGDEGFKGSSYLTEAAQSTDERSALSHAFGFTDPVFKWMASPEQAWRGQRVGKAMQQLHTMANGNVTRDYAWDTLETPVVDIGAGIGSLEMILLGQEHRGLQFTLFDLRQTMENAEKAWKARYPSKLKQISFVGGDFLAESVEETNIPQGQPTYIIRHVLHDWTDEQVVKILRNVRAAMLSGRSSSDKAGHLPKLVLCEMLLRASSSRFVHTTSVQLLSLNNGITRTESHMRSLVERAGFRVVAVHELRAADAIVEAIPDITEL
ncbi:hypothetical protein PHLCEN_2v7988 [Hermanssonia centrifuga]|uniref:Uncharacterized protein n=1 Tax=Hermanssonia centrifuga TaxID=98765 RepID=A0A2R6NUZ0_9APHY|nr:hypothetical protein PHLCEN_2v7988 [Hermanssonia centrifuga]